MYLDFFFLWVLVLFFLIPSQNALLSEGWDLTTAFEAVDRPFPLSSFSLLTTGVLNQYTQVHSSSSLLLVCGVSSLAAICPLLRLLLPLRTCDGLFSLCWALNGQVIVEEQQIPVHGSVSCILVFVPDFRRVSPSPHKHSSPSMSWPGPPHALTFPTRSLSTGLRITCLLPLITSWFCDPGGLHHRCPFLPMTFLCHWYTGVYIEREAGGLILLMRLLYCLLRCTKYTLSLCLHIWYYALTFSCPVYRVIIMNVQRSRSCIVS